MIWKKLMKFQTTYTLLDKHRSIYNRTSKHHFNIYKSHKKHKINQIVITYVCDNNLF